MQGTATRAVAGTSTGTAKALLCEAYVGKGGRRANAHDSDAVHIYLMNVLSTSDTSLEVRCALFEKVLARVEPTERVALLTPAGFFGYDSPYLDRAKAVAYLHSLKLRPDLLIAVGVDHKGGSPQVLHLIEGGAATRHREITRHRSTHAERLFSFGGLTFFGTVCGEFMSSTPNGPMYEQSQFFDAHRDILGRGIDVVLNAAHSQVKCTQTPDADSKRYPFETFFREVSRAGAACFLAHHHPDERWAPAHPKNHSYSNWGMYAGQGKHSDWMDVMSPVTEIEVY